MKKSLNSTIFSVGLRTEDRDLNQYKFVMPIFGAAYAAPNKGTTILYLISAYAAPKKGTAILYLISAYAAPNKGTIYT